MTPEQLERIVEALRNDQPLLQADNAALQDALDAWCNGICWNEAFGQPDAAENRRRRRDRLLQDYAAMLPQRGAAAIISQEVQKIRQKRRQTSPMLEAIDRIYRLPETERQIRRLLTKDI